MTHLTEREFFDEYDNLKEIERVIPKDRYNKVFEFLYFQFNHEKKTWITTKLLQEKMGIINHAYAYQILESFRILNLLKKTINNIGRAYYFPINIEYWEEANKIITKGKEDGKDKQAAI